MIAYVTVGADDIGRAKRFYSAFLPALGYRLTEGAAGLSWALPVVAGQAPLDVDFNAGQVHGFHHVAQLLSGGNV